MCGVLALLFIVVPAIEIYTLIAVGAEIGAIATLGIIVATGILGAALARNQGVAALRDLQLSFARGTDVGRSLVEAALVLVAGVLLLTPGFFTDAFGFSMLLPPIRRLAASAILARFADRASRMVMGGMPTAHMSWRSGAGQDGRSGDSRSGDSRPGDPVDQGDDESDDQHDPPPPGVIDV